MLNLSLAEMFHRWAVLQVWKMCHGYHGDSWCSASCCNGNPPEGSKFQLIWRILTRWPCFHRRWLWEVNKMEWNGAFMEPFPKGCVQVGKSSAVWWTSSGFLWKLETRPAFCYGIQISAGGVGRREQTWMKYQEVPAAEAALFRTEAIFRQHERDSLSLVRSTLICHEGSAYRPAHI